MLLLHFQRKPSIRKNNTKGYFPRCINRGGLFVTISYISHLVYPNFQAFKDPDSASLEIAMYIGGNLFQSIFLAGFITGGWRLVYQPMQVFRDFCMRWGGMEFFQREFSVIFIQNFKLQHTTSS